MLCATCSEASSETYSSEPKTDPWSLFITPGVPCEAKASLAQATTPRARMVSDSRHDTMQRLCQSITAVRYMRRPPICTQAMSVDHTYR